MNGKNRQEALHALRFAGTVLAVIAAVIGYLLIVRFAFNFSRWTGLIALAGTVVGLYWTANRWIRWLPGLLPFGILNTSIALITHRAPNGAPVSTGLSLLWLSYYTIGWAVCYWYVRDLFEHDSKASPFDRCAFIVFCGAVVGAGWSRISKHADLGFVTPIDFYAVAAGLTPIIFALVLRKWRARPLGRITG